MLNSETWAGKRKKKKKTIWPQIAKSKQVQSASEGRALTMGVVFVMNDPELVKHANQVLVGIGL
jgi:hypothetical protein